MYIVLGATGHVGGAAVTALLDAGQQVTAVIHDAAKAADLSAQGAAVQVVDVHDAAALRRVFQQGRRAFLLNPPAAVSGDTDTEERATQRSIVAALDQSGLEKVVLLSAYGAQPGAHCGDLGVLHEFEQALASQPIPVTVQRAAYFMSNWDALLDAAKAGNLPTFFPADLVLPMVAPEDIGQAAARRLQEPPANNDLHFVEGPQRYSSRDVANAFAKALGRPVDVKTIPREDWIETYLKLGFSDAAARSYANMTAVSVDREFAMPDAPERGRIGLDDYIARLVMQSGN